MNCSCVTVFVEFEICFSSDVQVSPYVSMTLISHGRGRHIAFSNLQKGSFAATFKSPVATWYWSAKPLHVRKVDGG